MVKGRSLLDYSNLLSPNEYEKNDNIKLKYFQKLEISIMNRLKKSKEEKNLLQ